jgi:polyisoprenoid-binding protein YceI
MRAMRSQPNRQLIEPLTNNRTNSTLKNDLNVLVRSRHDSKNREETKMRHPKWNLLFLALALAAAITLAAGAPSKAATWGVDSAHTEVNFSVKHFFTPVSGTFDEFEITLEYDAENPENSRVEAKIPVASVNTGNEKRDGHLLSKDFFEAEKFPYITFKSTSVRSDGNGQLVARGQLTIKGESREIDLPISLLGK